MRLLEFMFIDVWHYVGCFAVLLVIASIICRRPNVTNLYEVPLEYWKNIEKENADEDNRDPAEIEKEAAEKMWKRDV